MTRTALVLQRIAKLNNEGADHLEYGNLRSAAITFNEAFVRTKKYLRKTPSISTNGKSSVKDIIQAQKQQQQQQQQQKPQQQTQQQQQQQLTNMKQRSEHRRIRTQQQLQQQQEKKDMMGEGFLVYRKPIRVESKPDGSLVLCSRNNTKSSIPSPSSPSSSSSSSLMAQFDALAIVITFNLAITQHLHAIHVRGPKRVPQLLKALAMYDICHTKRAKAGISWDMIYSMGLINNSGLIHYELGKVTTSTRFFEFLLSVCIIEQQQHHGNNNITDSTNNNNNSTTASTEPEQQQCPLRELFRNNATNVMVRTQACAPMA